MSLCLLFAASLFYINQPSVPMRQDPSVKADVVSSAYYGENVHVVDEFGDWVMVHTDVDSYPGWVPKNSVYKADHKLFVNTPVAMIARAKALVYDRQDTVLGPIAALPFESRVEVVDATHPRWIAVRGVDGTRAYIQRGDLDLDYRLYTLEETIALAHQFIGLPYTWGGRSSFGYDCSGFVQMLYRQMGVYLRRDSKDQASDEMFAAVTKEELQPGDLIFWGFAEDEIKHVGFYLGNDEFIHTSVRENMPWVRKSLLTDPEWLGVRGGQSTYTYRTFRSIKS
ncbi:MAG: C40 family peptidase [Chlamydiales bacterium]|nr:C40 family peptidase [Chlamydiales bacterium]